MIWKETLAYSFCCVGKPRLILFLLAHRKLLQFFYVSPKFLDEESFVRRHGTACNEVHAALRFSIATPCRGVLLESVLCRPYMMNILPSK